MWKIFLGFGLIAATLAGSEKSFAESVSLEVLISGSAKSGLKPDFAQMPEASGLKFLANTAYETAKYPKYASMPVPRLGEVGYASHPRARFISRAKGVCKYFGYQVARFARSAPISSTEAELIQVDQDGFGYSEKFQSLDQYRWVWDPSRYAYTRRLVRTDKPTYFSHLECFK